MAVLMHRYFSGDVILENQVQSLGVVTIGGALIALKL
jgi:hypothetical protein